MRVAGRLLTIHRVLVRYGLDDFVRATHLYRPLRFVFWLSPWTWFRRRQGTRGERLRRALEDLGPIFVKFGQVVSTRRDLLPADIADELAKLQDRVPPFDGALAKARIESSLGRPVAELFANFDATPLAAASIAQVHAATLPDGREVVVKVLRPGMREAIDRDLEVLQALAGLAEEYWPESRRLRPREVVVEYEKTILNELDLMREAGNASQLKRTFAGSALLHVPEVHWDLCRQDVMVMERIRGIQISEVARLRELGTDIRKLAENGVTIFFSQVFRHNFFHADMHPGNIFVDVADPASPRYAAVDFGIVGTLDPRDQLYLAGNFLAFFERDYRRVAVLHLESGYIAPPLLHHRQDGHALDHVSQDFAI
jgi:ubiquinone biosynthesis protein